MSSDGLHIYLALVRAALLGVVRWGGFSSHIVHTCPLARMASEHWFFNNMYYKHLGHSSKTWGLRSILEGSILMSDVFRRRIRSCQQISFHCPFRVSYWYFFLHLIHQSSCCYPPLLPGWSFSPLSSGGFLGARDRPKKGSLFSRGYNLLVGTSPRLQSMSWEVFYLPYCFLIKWQRIYIGISSMISNELILVVLFPLNYVEEERIK